MRPKRQILKRYDLVMDIRKTTINNIRVLSAEMIDKANSGHPGLPLGCAGIGYEL